MGIPPTFGKVAARPLVRVWLLSFLTLAAAIAAYVWWLRPIAAEARPSMIWWPIIAVGFTLAELRVVDVHFRRERHSFSLSEVPGVVGLFTLSPMDFLFAVTVGTGAALMVEARQSRVRRSFNLANSLLGAVLMLTVFHTLTDVNLRFTHPQPYDWLVTALAALIGGGTQTVLVAAVITVSGGAPQFQRLGRMLQFATMVYLTNSSIGLMAVVVMSSDPQALALLTIPVVVIYFAYQAYVSERVKHERLELLYESSRILQHSPELDESVFALLEHARKMFRAEIAQIVIFPDRAAGQALQTTSIHEGLEERMIPTRPESEPALWTRVRQEQSGFFWRPAGEEWLADRRLRQVMVSPLTGESGPLGMMLVANCLSEGTDFDPEDLRLLETVSNQVGIALENGQLEKSLSELSRLKEELRYQAFHDALTAMPNRSLFTEQVELRLAHRTLGESPVVMFLDLDDFKVVNDTLGHAIGDQLLAAVGARIQGTIRGRDLAARLGGDEFAVLLEPGSTMVDALAIADRLVSTLRAPFPVAGQEILVGASVGVAAAREDTSRADDLLRNADVAMYTAKSNGKRRVAIFDPLVHAELRARHELSAELSRSLGRGELEVYYQPIVVLATGEIKGVEALVRWRHPTRGHIPPEEFVRLAEETGSIESLGVFVLNEACRQAAAWRRRMDPASGFYINVNVSPRQLQHANFRDTVEKALAESGLPAEHLVLEMTETGMLEDTQATITKLRSLQQLGVRIAVDDFGTGYSSLSYLRRFPIDILKIAKDFVSIDGTATDEGIEDDPWAFARAIVALGQTLRLSIIAEGIETAEQHAELVRLGCVLGQGFFFGRPLPPDAFILELERVGMLMVDPANPVDPDAGNPDTLPGVPSALPIPA